MGDERSSPWRIWDHGDELYISARNIGGLFKASIHSSGILNFSFTSEFFNNDKLEPPQSTRHLHSETLVISEENMQVVFWLLVPLDRMSKCEFKLNKMTRLAIPDNSIGTAVVKVIHVPHHKRSAAINSKAVYALGYFCSGMYVITWNVHSESSLIGFQTSKQIELGDIEYDRHTRAITPGFLDDNSGGFFLDTTWP